ncbi:uncharacterized protein LOC114688148 isoform X3 [Peromyscus leucopus]|uniref:uncharacterized protein LOC114688148 isoform X3 n=1 Tax=Peromyscus leucopus TaxID=10041 RepID=UPI0018858443|nr:uncharacterized protein LOC114688148 isoform X3 [Peromyscus leucopus]
MARRLGRGGTAAAGCSACIFSGGWRPGLARDRENGRRLTREFPRRSLMPREGREKFCVQGPAAAASKRGDHPIFHRLASQPSPEPSSISSYKKA